MIKKIINGKTVVGTKKDIEDLEKLLQVKEKEVKEKEVKEKEVDIEKEIDQDKNIKILKRIIEAEEQEEKIDLEQEKSYREKLINRLKELKQDENGSVKLSKSNDELTKKINICTGLISK